MIVTEEKLTVTTDLAGFTHDPLRAVLYGFPWGEGELANIVGPRKWQRTLLEDIGKHLQNPETRHTPFKGAVSSGHGIGKSALVALVTWWALSTFEYSRVITTANTKGQLDTKTQPEADKWFRLALNSDCFEVNTTSIRVKDDKIEKAWRNDYTPWSDDNAQAFAGAHNHGRRLVLIMDEASEISAKISEEVARGVLTDADTEIIWLKFGNPTQNSGDFYDCVFGDQRHRWHTYVIDSREVEQGVNLQELKEWEEDYGEDSDFFRVRVRGLPPRAASGQFIDQDTIKNAQERIVRSLPDDPLIAGVDFAWGGADDNVVRFRKGFDARTIPPLKVKGEFTRDPAVMTQKLADILSRSYNGEKVAMLFCDSAGIAGPIVQRLRTLGFSNVAEVNFGAQSPDPKAAYWRDCMWMRMREWLAQGAIDRDPGLAADLAKPMLVSERMQRIKLEPKDVMHKRLVKLGMNDTSSPDDGDSLAVTFAMDVAPAARPSFDDPLPRTGVWS